MTVPEPLATHSEPVVVELAAIARQRGLAVFAGAGISLAAGLPSGEQMARDTYGRLSEAVDLPACNPNDLLSVADSAEAANALATLQRVIQELFPLTTASPAYAHSVLAMLLLEGVAPVLSANFDTCIERAGMGSIATVVDQGELGQVVEPRLLKVHGCATKPVSMLVSSSQLAQAPLWADATVGGILSQDRVVFVGMGDPPPYVRLRLSDFLGAVGHTEQVYVVSPQIVVDWAESQWSDVTPDLPEGNRIGLSGEEFLDQLLREYIRVAVQEFERQEAAWDAEGKYAAGFDSLRDAIHKRSGLAFARWLRDAAPSWTPGQTLVHADLTTRALMAACRAIAEGTVSIAPGGTVESPIELMAGEDRPAHLVLVPGNQAATRVDRDVRARAAASRTRGEKGWGASALTVLCAGHVGALRSLSNGTSDIVAALDGTDVLEGPTATQVHYVDLEVIATS